jgi:hypothetical protein
MQLIDHSMVAPGPTSSFYFLCYVQFVFALSCTFVLACSITVIHAYIL